MANLIKNYRQVLLDGIPPDWLALLFIGSYSIGIIVLMMWVFKRLDTTYARLAIQ
jgi:ABC-type polysaccharide/polyol phosphate export permease